jgi:hypothetical protein
MLNPSAPRKEILEEREDKEDKEREGSKGASRTPPHKSLVKPEGKPYTYAILQETSEEESETWIYFIRYQGNEEALKHLERQISSVLWEIDDGLCVYDMEMNYLVSERTAKEMTKVDLNHTSFHRKFDGKLKMIDLGFRSDDSTRRKMKRAFKVLGYGRIDEYIDEEDIDPEDMCDENDENNTSSEDESSSSSEEDERERRRERRREKRDEPRQEPVQKRREKREEHKPRAESDDEENNDKRRLPKVMQKVEIPRIAKIKQGKHKHRDK